MRSLSWQLVRPRMNSDTQYFNVVHEGADSPRVESSSAIILFGLRLASRVARDKPWSTLCKKSYGIPSSPRATAVAKFRLLTGHDCLCAHLFRFNLVTSTICVLCDTGQDMTAAHLDECSALNDLNYIVKRLETNVPAVQDMMDILDEEAQVLVVEPVDNSSMNSSLSSGNHRPFRALWIGSTMWHSTVERSKL
ncbi:uncharacterized protein TNCV_2785191 [Trichonephila clavipes]|nr:uncharacterized protein TNCV_2785191 [Trichonephila clavipes]